MNRARGRQGRCAPDFVLSVGSVSGVFGQSLAHWPSLSPAVLPPVGSGLFDWHCRFSAILLFAITSPPVFWLAWKFGTFNEVRRTRLPKLSEKGLERVAR